MEESGGLPAALKRKIGPLVAWQWGVAIGVVVLAVILIRGKGRGAAGDAGGESLVPSNDGLDGVSPGIGGGTVGSTFPQTTPGPGAGTPGAGQPDPEGQAPKPGIGGSGLLGVHSGATSTRKPPVGAPVS